MGGEGLVRGASAPSLAPPADHAELEGVVLRGVGKTLDRKRTEGNGPAGGAKKAATIDGRVI